MPDRVMQGANHMRRILIIRRDNIGDMILTTPLIHALRRQMHDAHIAVLGTSYNAPVLMGNMDIDAIHTYTKAKHTGSLFSALKARWQEARLFWQLRRAHFTDIVLAELGYHPRNVRLAQFIKAGRAGSRIIGFEDENATDQAARGRGLDVVIFKPDFQDMHYARLGFLLAGAFGIDTSLSNIPPCRVVPDRPSAVPVERIPSGADTSGLARLRIGLHMSARKPSQRWSAEAFTSLAKLLSAPGASAECGRPVELVLFWSPGSEDNLMHPGDDAKAATVGALLRDAGIGFTARPTSTLRDLIDRVAEVDVMVCADGGAMHVAAGLGKPIVALFGDSDIAHWHPWGVDYRALQAPSRNVMHISPVEVYDALREICATLR